MIEPTMETRVTILENRLAQATVDIAAKDAFIADLVGELEKRDFGSEEGEHFEPRD